MEKAANDRRLADSIFIAVASKRSTTRKECYGYCQESCKEAREEAGGKEARSEETRSEKTRCEKSTGEEGRPEESRQRSPQQSASPMRRS